MNNYLIELQTNFNFGEANYVEGLLRSWCRHPDKTLRPEKFGLGEPVRRSIAEEGEDAVVKTWIDHQASLLLKRVTKPKFHVDMNWRPTIGLDTRPYPFGCTVWLALYAGDEKAIALLKWMIQQFKPEFAFVTTYDDYLKRHFAKVPNRFGTVEKILGTDVRATLPGIYWCTYFGPEVLSRVPELSVCAGIAFDQIDFQSGVLLRVFESSSEIGSSPAAKGIDSIYEMLGKEKFFNLAEATREFAEANR